MITNIDMKRMINEYYRKGLGETFREAYNKDKDRANIDYSNLTIQLKETYGIVSFYPENGPIGYDIIDNEKAAVFFLRYK